jgi:xanthine dehydrogenase YagR molybdenum-binding subunit
MPSQARVIVSQSGRYQVLIAAADIGTGARTALLAVAAEALGVPAAAIDLRIGDSALPPAMIAGGSMGTASWTWAVIKACRALHEAVRARDGAVPPGGLSAHADTTADIGALPARARYAFGAQFAEVRVDADTGEVRVPRLLGVFAAGRIVSPAGGQGDRRGGHRGHGCRHRQRGAPRHRDPGPRPADPARQAAERTSMIQIRI